MAATVEHKAAKGHKGEFVPAAAVRWRSAPFVHGGRHH